MFCGFCPVLADELGLATAEQDVTTAALEAQGRKMMSHSSMWTYMYSTILRIICLPVTASIVCVCVCVCSCKVCTYASCVI